MIPQQTPQRPPTEAAFSLAIDFSSGAWKTVAAWAESQLAAARQRNDNVDLTEAQTAANRGEIRSLKKLLGLPAEAARAKQSGSASAHL